MFTVRNHIKKNLDRYLEELFSLIRIPSISAKEEHKKDMYKVAEQWKYLLKMAGCDKAEIYETEGNPIVFGEKIVDPKLPTVLVYGHMDVMPVEPLELWDSAPFEPIVEHGKIWGRGADDDKGQSFMHLKAFEFLAHSEELKRNVKFLIEGEEEIGSPSLPKFIDENKELLTSDIIVVSDTSMLGADTPSITTGLRGLAYWDIEVTGPNVDLHSGIFGGAVANPINELCKIITQLQDEKGHITIPGFYDGIAEPSEEERALTAKIPFNEEEYKKALGVRTLTGEEGYSAIENTSSRPSFDVCGIWGGHTGEGSKTVLPSKAYAKISTRLVAGQDYNNISKLMIDHIASITPEYVTVKVTAAHGGQAYECPTDIPEYKAAEEAYHEVFGKKPIPVKRGGSIPIIATFEEKLGVKTILMGFGLEEDAIHSPNENFPLEMFQKGIETIILFYRNLFRIG